MPEQVMVEVPTALISQYLDLFNNRDIPGVRKLASDLEQLAPLVGLTSKNAAQLVLPLTTAADLDFLPLQTLECFLLRFPVEMHEQLYAHDLLKVRLGYGVVQFRNGAITAAIADFDHILNAAYCNDHDLRIQSFYYKGRCLEVLGRDGDALAAIHAARVLAEQYLLIARAAAIKVKEASLLRRQGKDKEADQLLAESWDIAQGTPDYVAQGNILGYRGEIARKRGLYSCARLDLEAAVELWGKHKCHQRYVGRDLTELGLVLTLEARRVGTDLNAPFNTAERKLEKMIAEAVRMLKQKVACGEESLSPAAIVALTRVLQGAVQTNAQEDLERTAANVDNLQDKGREHFEAARFIYSHPVHPRGLVTNNLNYAMLDMDLGDHDAAVAKVRSAQKVAPTDDVVAQARIAIMDAKLVRAKGSLATASRRALEGWRLAEGTQDARLQARAATCCGQCAKDDGNVASAREWWNVAFPLLQKAESRDYAWDELVELNRGLVPNGIETLARELLEQAHLGTTCLKTIEHQFGVAVVADVQRATGSKRETATILKTSEKKVRENLEELSGVVKSHDTPKITEF